MIIYEGPNGTGKTSYVVATSGVIGGKVYRAFKPSGAHHDPEYIGRLRALGLPVNTFVDDMYLADMSRMVENELVVDRSMPSAIAYEMVEKQGTLKADWVKYMLEWEKLMELSYTPALIVRLVAPYVVARERMSGHIPTGDEYERLDAWFERILAILDHIPVMTIDTSKLQVAEGVRLVKERYKELCQPSNSSAVG